MIKRKQFNNVYITGIGLYLPPFRIKVEAIAKVWGKDAQYIKDSLGIAQKSVSARDEDSTTMAVLAALRAIKQSGIDKKKLGAIFVGSESHPYAVKSTGTIVAEWLDLSHEYFCTDLQFACKAATAGIQIIASMIESELIEEGLVIGVDKSQSKPGDALEYAAASAASAVIFSKAKGAAKLQATYSYNSDTPDFWRRQTREYPEHAGRFTGLPAYFKHVEKCTTQFLKQINRAVSDFDHVVLHMPNAKFPYRCAKLLKIAEKQLKTGLIVKYVGNPYSASSLLGLSRVLAYAKKGENILMTSYGSGAGSDSFWFSIEKSGTKKEQNDFDKQLKQNTQLDYSQYLQCMNII